ncbi:uncharacterized protein BO97DRAFT_424480 [Aspergillus homomorphus CBS 101889]|uniref:Tat pathway signal sequence n=1 Tax=Aspergillus homomorphus (strain CBS 101889) TaxID=1450537 RepID=A0A395HWW0_ASPHC|nr:hypothetical protein BO97DRAFT_424480 [Aspergillus homomorphus CBS 101889]RAL12391.1 hypothetical protein BO97DRAFT_424480 [Aspergillus homomorphus CBS 101889]
MASSSIIKELPYQHLDPASEPDNPAAMLWSARSSTSLTSQGRAVVEGIRLFVALTLALTIGWVAGQRLSIASSQDGLLLPPGTIQTVWSHNYTFSQRPNPESEEAWRSLIPVGRGFVHHLELAPFISSISVFHQLHCLHAIVVSYHRAMEDVQIAKGQLVEDDYLNRTGTRMGPSHIQHCFEYLRQALICAADTNLEELDPDTRVTTGWGQVRQCRDYASVVAWAEKWANSSERDILS